MKCDTPARERGSSREPVAIQSPSATDRVPGTRSLMRRSPPRKGRRLGIAHGGDRIRGSGAEAVCRPTLVANVMNGEGRCRR